MPIWKKAIKGDGRKVNPRANLRLLEHCAVKCSEMSTICNLETPDRIPQGSLIPSISKSYIFGEDLACKK
jgi:hypothetical protein